MHSTRVCIIGAGPAALSLAYRLRQLAIDVICLAPDFETPWKANYAAWQWELEGLEEQDLIEKHWPSVELFWEQSPVLQANHGYCRLNRLELQQFYVKQLRASGAEFLRGCASTVQIEDGHYRVDWENTAAPITAELVFDCTGAQSTLSPAEEPAIGYQSAYGILAEIQSGTKALGDSLVLMDYREQDLFNAEPATFLYAMPLGGNKYFLEETCLASFEPVSFDMLRERLEKRLAKRKVVVGQIHEVERCLIPLGRSLPRQASAGPIPYGAAAAMVNPASGYLLGRLLRDQPALAKNIRETLQKSDALSERSTEIQTLLWPPDQRRMWEMYRFGLRVLCSMRADQTLQFFDAFFRLDSARWLGYLTARQCPEALSAFMLRLFWEAPWSIKYALTKSLMGSGGLQMLKEIPPLLIAGPPSGVES